MGTQRLTHSRTAAWAYWTLVVLLVGFGGLTMVSIGFPLLALGLVLMAVAPLRRSPSLFWPPVVAVIAVFAAWWIFGPVVCVAETTPSGAERRWCESMVGLTCEGDPTWIGPVLGIVASSAVFAGFHFALRRHRPA